MAKQSVAFKSDVAQVLDIVIHSLYSHREIFLRELVSNASDACDKLRYAVLTHPDLARGAAFQITLTPDKKARTLTISDNGIGMSRDDLINHLGTIARSGSAEFLKSLSSDKSKDMSLIGRFGVGFYSAFMAADKVVVRTRKAGETDGHIWESDGAGAYTIDEDASPVDGTEITLHLKKDADEFLEPIRIRHLVKTYSDHISVPIVLKSGAEQETINAASALWRRNKSEITDTQYKDFYQSLTHAFDAPWMTLHYAAEGAIDYTALLFVPTKPPFDLFRPDRKSGLHLYANKVFVTDDIPDLMPHGLRFVTGVIDTADLPLNVSRELLQSTPALPKIKAGLTKKILAALKKRAEKADDYAVFWESFGAVLKEGLYEPSEYRADIAGLCRFYSTAGDGLTSFADYVGRMKDGQENIYYISGTDRAVLRAHPQLEGFAARGVEVLLLTDPVDEFWVQTFGEYDKKKIVSVMHAKPDIDKIKPPAQDAAESLDKKALDDLCARIKETLGDSVAAVRPTDRLTKSPLALVTPEGNMSLNLERLMRAHGQQTAFSSPRVLEVNPRHPLMRKVSGWFAGADKARAADVVAVLYGQALIIEGEPVKNPAEFGEKLAALLMRE
ncbi:MAG: molecular chaperone HtpG [Alphaproteobacteria bacterium]|nr:molecular chaperone HtpG [Alphaproteobacteria bacterium]